MVTSRSVSVAVAIVAAASVPATASTRSSAPTLDRLNGRVARGIAEKRVSRAVRRSPRLDTAAFRECARGLRGIDCLFVAHGQTANAEFDCRLKVLVRSGHRHPSGRIVARTCQVTLRPLLTAARASAAIATVAKARIGSDGPIELRRISRSVFDGYVAWPPAPKAPPLCVFRLTAELKSSGAVLVQSRGVTCAA